MKKHDHEYILKRLSGVQSAETIIPRVNEYQLLTEIYSRTSSCCFHESNVRYKIFRKYRLLLQTACKVF